MLYVIREKTTTSKLAFVSQRSWQIIVIIILILPVASMLVAIAYQTSRRPSTMSTSRATSSSTTSPDLEQTTNSVDLEESTNRVDLEESTNSVGLEESTNIVPSTSIDICGIFAPFVPYGTSYGDSVWSSGNPLNIEYIPGISSAMYNIQFKVPSPIHVVGI